MLQDLKYGFSTRLLSLVDVVLFAGVDDLAVVDNDGVAGGALARDPGVFLAELGVGVGGEDLAVRPRQPQREEGDGGDRARVLTIKSSVTPWALPQADMT